MDPFLIPNFEEFTTGKLTHYYVVSERSMDKLRRRYNLQAMTPLWQNAKQAWDADPVNNPTTWPPRPFTADSVYRFYAKCDAICSAEPTTSGTPELFRIAFAANIGAQFVFSILLSGFNDRGKIRIRQAASKRSMDILFTPAQLRALHAGEDATPSYSVAPGDVLTFQDRNTVRKVRIKDHGTSALKGEFYVVTTILDEEQDDDSSDREISLSEMEEWVLHRVDD